MRDLWLGLTDLYNLFHASDLPAQLAKLWTKRDRNDKWRSNIPAGHLILQTYPTPEAAQSGIEELRSLHVQLDQTVLAAYGWHQSTPGSPAIDLAHGFHDLDFLPEKDRTRYTLHPTARRELLTRLLKLNHTRAAEEHNAQLAAGKLSPSTKRAKQTIIQLPTDDLDLFRPAPAIRTTQQPRELSLPTCKRLKLDTSDTFLIVFINEFLSKADDQSTLRNLDGVFHLLRHRKAHQTEITSVLGDIGEKWIKRFNDTLPNDDFIPFLKRLESQKWIKVDGLTGAISRLPAFQTVPPNEWRAFDIEAALIILSSRPEVLEMVTSEEGSSRSTQAFGITKTA